MTYNRCNLLHINLCIVFFIDEGVPSMLANEWRTCSYQLPDIENKSE